MYLCFIYTREREREVERHTHKERERDRVSERERERERETIIKGLSVCRPKLAFPSKSCQPETDLQ